MSGTRAYRLAHRLAQEGGAIDFGGFPDAPFLSQWGAQVAGPATPVTDEEEGVSAAAGFAGGKPWVHYVPQMRNENTPFELGHHEAGHAGVQYFWGDPRKGDNFERKLRERWGGLGQYGYDTEEWEEIRQRQADQSWLMAHPQQYPTERGQAQLALQGVSPEALAGARDYNTWLNQLARTEMWRASPGAGSPTARQAGGRLDIAALFDSVFGGV